MRLKGVLITSLVFICFLFAVQNLYTASLPSTGDTNWGTALNNFLKVTLDEDTGYHIHPFTDVKSAGAVGDNITDDTVAFQTALDAGGIIFVPAGTYKITAQLDIDQTYTWLRGAGRTKTKLNFTQTGGTHGINLVKFGASAWCYYKISDMLISGNSSAGDGIYIDGALNGTVIESVNVCSFGGAGIHLYGPVYFSEIGNVHSYSNDGDGFLLDDDGSLEPNANTFSTCWASSNGGDGFDNTTGHGNVLMGGDFESNTGYGVKIDHAHGFSLYGTWIEGNTAGSIQTTSLSEAVIIESQKLSGTPDLYWRSIGALHVPARSAATGVPWYGILSRPHNQMLIGNTVMGLGSVITIAGEQLEPYTGITYADDARALFGRVAQLNAQNERVGIESAYIKCPEWIRPGNYRIFIYAKSTNAVAGDLKYWVRNNTESQNLVYAQVTPPATDAFPALPTGGAPFTVDDTEHGDSVILRLWKRTSDANTISISHVVIIPDMGYGLPDVDNSDAATDGTGEDDLQTATIYYSTMGVTGGLRITAAGTITGANDAKEIKLHFGASSWSIISAAAADETDWRIEAEIFNTAANAQRISWKGLESDTTETSGYETAAINTAADITLKLTGTCTHADDTITQTMWIVERL